MKTIDLRFDEHMISILKSMVNSKMLKYKCDPFVYSPAVYGIAGVCTESGSYAFTNQIEVLDHYGADEDVAVFRIEERPEEQIVSLVQDVKIVDVPVNRVIREIKVINEHQMLYDRSEQIYDVWLTRGVIFIMSDDLEIAFEKSVWFSEMIIVTRGENLLEQFTPTASFAEEWEDPYRGECERNVISIQKG